MPFSVGMITTDVSFVVVGNAPVDLIIGRLTMKFLCVSLDFEKDMVTFKRDRVKTRIPLWTEGGQMAGVVSYELRSDE